MRLKDQAAIVTGGASGIGRGICLAMAREGATVAVADLNVAGAKAVAQEIEGSDGRALGVQTDVTSSRSVRDMVHTILGQFGHIDILVNNAGWDKFGPFLESDEETWDKVIALNLKGPIICARAVLDDMVARQSGKIITIASEAGKVGSSGEVVYSGAKGGVIGFTKALAREMARHKINVNCVCPGPADTPLFGQLVQEYPKLAEALKKAIPWRRLGTPEDIAPLVVFLASDDARYITGQAWSVSGGLTMC